MLQLSIGTLSCSSSLFQTKAGISPEECGYYVACHRKDEIFSSSITQLLPTYFQAKNIKIVKKNKKNVFPLTLQFRALKLGEGWQFERLNSTIPLQVNAVFIQQFSP